MRLKLGYFSLLSVQMATESNNTVWHVKDMIAETELPDSYIHLPDPKCSVTCDGESTLEVDLTVNGNTAIRLSFEYIASLLVQYCVGQLKDKSVRYAFSVLVVHCSYK